MPAEGVGGSGCGHGFVKTNILRAQETTVVAAPRRAALALLSVLAVVLAASLFPATGFGPHPGGGGTAGPATPAAGTDGVEGPTPTDGRGEESDTGSGTGTPTPTPTPSPTPTPTPTPTSTPIDPPSSSDSTGGLWDGSGIYGAILALLVLSGVGLLVGVAGRSDARSDDDSEADADGDPDGRGPSTLDPLYRLLPPPLTAGLRRLAAGTTALLVGGATAVPPALSALSNVTRAVSEGLGAAIDAIGRPLGRGLASLPRALGAGLAGLGGGLTAALSAVPGAVTGLGSGLSLSRADDDPTATGTPTADARETAADDAGWLPPSSVSEAWGRLRATVGVRRDSVTPGEVATVALDRGWPTEPVVTLTQSFREVRYGGLPESEGRLRAAKDALRRVETDSEEGGDGDGDGDAGSGTEAPDGPDDGDGDDTGGDSR